MYLEVHRRWILSYPFESEFISQPGRNIEKESWLSVNNQKEQSQFSIFSILIKFLFSEWSFACKWSSLTTKSLYYLPLRKWCIDGDVEASELVVHTLPPHSTLCSIIVPSLNTNSNSCWNLNRLTSKIWILIIQNDQSN